MSLSINTAKSSNLALCPKCHKLNLLSDESAHEKIQCIRCHGFFNQRKSHSLQYTLAWNIAALIAFVPANLYPIMIIYSLGIGDPSTILSGIGQFVDQGLYPIAVIIFTQLQQLT